jgi:OmpA-OmpF porin, OOP family
MGENHPTVRHIRRRNSLLLNENGGFVGVGSLGYGFGNGLRFIQAVSGEKFAGTAATAAGVVPAGIKLRNQNNHRVLFGVRYAFNVAAPTLPSNLRPRLLQPAPADSFTVFFDRDKAPLNDRVRQIIKEAAGNSTRVQYIRIEVNGHTATSRKRQYNQGLSLRRARAVQAELVGDGVPQNAITIQRFGDTHLLVTTDSD